MTNDKCYNNRFEENGIWCWSDTQQTWDDWLLYIYPNQNLRSFDIRLLSCQFSTQLQQQSSKNIAFKIYSTAQQHKTSKQHWLACTIKSPKMYKFHNVYMSKQTMKIKNKHIAIQQPLHQHIRIDSKTPYHQYIQPFNKNGKTTLIYIIHITRNPRKNNQSTYIQFDIININKNAQYGSNVSNNRILESAPKYRKNKHIFESNTDRCCVSVAWSTLKAQILYEIFSMYRKQKNG